MKQSCSGLKFLALVMVWFLCGSVHSADSESVVVRVWTPFAAEPMNSAFEKIVQDFNGLGTGVEIEHAAFDDAGYRTVLKTSFLGGSQPDIVFLNPGGIMFQFAEAGFLSDISSYMESREEEVSEGLDEFYELNGASYGVPFTLNVGNLLYFNRDILEQNGIQQDDIRTWEGFIFASSTIAESGVWPIAFGNKESWPGSHLYNHLLLRILGPSRYNQIFLRTYNELGSSQDLWTDELPVSVWEEYLALRNQNLFSPGYLTDTYFTSNALFLNGQAAFFINGSWFSGDLASKAPDLNWGVMPFPVVSAASDQLDLVFSGLVISVSAESDSPTGALAFVDHLTSEAVQKFWAESNQRLSPFNYDSENWNYAPQFRQIAELANQATDLVLFGDMLEDFECSKPWIWDVSQGILIDSISAVEIGELHEKCIERVRSRRGFNGESL